MSDRFLRHTTQPICSLQSANSISPQKGILDAITKHYLVADHVCVSAMTITMILRQYPTGCICSSSNSWYLLAQNLGYIRPIMAQDWTSRGHVTHSGTSELEAVFPSNPPHDPPFTHHPTDFSGLVFPPNHQKGNAPPTNGPRTENG